MFCTLQRLFLRFRYPVVLPEEVAKTLGMEVPVTISFDELIEQLTHPPPKASRLRLFSDRNIIEKHFVHAQRVERFGQTTLVSYYFVEGWLELDLHFDKNESLRRVCLIHRKIPGDHGLEIPLLSEPLPPSPTPSQTLDTNAP